MTMYTHEREKQAKPAVIHTAAYPTPDDSLMTLMHKYLDVRHLSLVDALYNNWYPSSTAGDTLPRIVIPATSQHVGHQYWQARLMDPEDAESKRYQSPAAARLDAVIVCHPRHPLYANYGVITEGPMCALAAAELGRTGIALMGNTPSIDVLHHVAALCTHSRWIFLADSDAVPQAMTVVGQLAALGVVVKLRTIPGEKDLAEASRRLRFQLVTWED